MPPKQESNTVPSPSRSSGALWTAPRSVLSSIPLYPVLTFFVELILCEIILLICSPVFIVCVCPAGTPSPLSPEEDLDPSG